MEILVLDAARKQINVGDKVIINRDGHLRTSYVFKIDIDGRHYSKVLLSTLPVTQYGLKKNDGRSELHYVNNINTPVYQSHHRDWANEYYKYKPELKTKEYYYTNTLIVIKNEM